MRFAISNGERVEPSPGQMGSCPRCVEPVTAKCGSQRIWHWAHQGKRVCDSWWENETPWHRDWKDQFPVGWQEVIQQDTNGERHIADVKTAEGWVLEFQHSYLKPEERSSRNDFVELHNLNAEQINQGFDAIMTELRSIVSRDELQNQARRGKVSRFINPIDAVTLSGRWRSPRL